MIQRENDLTTYIGFGVDIPHGVSKSKELMKKSGIVVLQFLQGVDFGEEKYKQLKTTKDVNFIYETFTAN